MNIRSVSALLVLAFVCGAIAFGWFASGTDAPWMQSDNEAASPSSAATSRQIAALPAAPTFIPAQPVVADSAHTGAMLLAMAARRAIENGKPIDALLPQLQATFGAAQPQALAALAKAGGQPLSNAALLSEFEILAPILSRPAGTGWERMRYEFSTLFVLRKEANAAKPLTARLGRVRQNLIDGQTQAAVRLVRAMPGAANAADWIAKAEQAIAVQQALDGLDHAALSAITAPPVPVIIPVPEKAAPVLSAPDTQGAIAIDAE
jgi:hypothetical protein